MLLIGPDRDLLIRYRETSGREYGLHVDGWLCALAGRTFHAVHADTVRDHMESGSRRRTYDAACGKRVRLFQFPAAAPLAFTTALWPPRVATISSSGERCRECWESTGRRRPSGYFPDDGGS